MHSGPKPMLVFWGGEVFNAAHLQHQASDYYIAKAIRMNNFDF